MSKKRIEVNDLSGSQYSLEKNIRFKTSTLRSNLCSYSDAYIIVKWRVNLRGSSDANRTNEKLNLKNNAPFRSCI